MKWILVLLLSLNFYAWAQDSEPEEVEVVLGIDKVLKLNFVPNTQLQIGDKSKIFVQVIPQKKEITIKGKKTGKSSLKIRTTTGDIKGDYIITVSTNEKAKTVKELKQFLGEIEGLEIGLMGDTVYVGGNLVVPKDIGKIVTVLEKYPDVMKLIELSEHTQRVIAKKMQEEIHRNGLTNINVRIVNGSFLLEGVTDKAQGDQLALDIAKLYLPDKLQSLSSQYVDKVKREPLISLITVNTKQKPEPPPKQLKITAQFVEISKGYNSAFGIRWTPVISGDGGSINIGKTVSGEVTTRSSGTLTGTISNLFPKLNSAKAAGYARVVQSGMVVVKENVKAVLDKNQKFPFSVGGTENAQAATADIGFSFTTKAAILQKENVSLEVGLNVGLPGEKQENGSPTSIKNKISTTLVVKNKESAAIGGIVINSENVDYDKIPGVTLDEQSQFLFRFVRQKDYSSAKSQFVVFVTPEILENASKGTEEIRRKFRKRGR